MITEKIRVKKNMQHNKKSATDV
uniref:Uncharacterized protein n=1 Tax=Arundo donax TaxID=35708 RepID=A0A0A8ZJ10_ARUDO